MALFPSLAAAERAYLLSNPAQQVGWVYVSPTSTHIAYSAYDPADNNLYLYTRRLDPAAAPVKLQFPGASGLSGYSEDVGISPDGSRIAYRGIQNREDDRPLAYLYTSPIDGGAAPVAMYNTPYSGGDTICEYSFAFPRDNLRIIYKATQGDIGDYQLYSRPTDGSDAAVRLSTNVDVNHYVASEFSLSRDGRRVIYSSWQRSSTASDLCSSPVNGSSPPIKLNEAPASGAAGGGSFGPTTERVIYVLPVGYGQPSSLYSRPIDASGPPLKLADSGSKNFVKSTLSPDGAYALYVLETSDGKHQDLFSRPVNASRPSAQLTRPTTGRGLYFSNYAVSPDSGRVVYAASDLTNPNLAGLYSQVIDGSADPIELGPVSAGFGGISPDSRRVVYTLAGARENTNDFYSLPIDGSGSSIKLNAAFGDARVIDMTITPDSRFAIFNVDSDIDWHCEALYAVPMGGGDPLRLSDPLPQYTEILSYRVTPDGSMVIYETGWSGPYEQWKQTVPGIYAAPIPEPTGLGLMGVAAIGLLARHRARRTMAS